jgi:hypothetical protein
MESFFRFFVNEDRWRQGSLPEKRVRKEKDPMNFSDLYEGMTIHPFLSRQRCVIEDERSAASPSESVTF